MIAGATGNTYVLVGTDVGGTIRCRVTGTNGGGSTTAIGAQSGVVSAVAPANTVLPTISGTAKQLQSLTRTTGTWTGSPTFATQWLRCDAAGANPVAIASATGSTYVLTAADVGSTIRSRVTGTNGGGSVAAESVQTATIVSVRIISMVSGGSGTGFFGDGLDYVSARMNNPTAMTYDAAGNLYIADSGNHRIRRVTTGGIISTVAGTTSSGFSGDGAAATAAQLFQPQGMAFDATGNLYIADTSNNRVRKVTTGGIISTVAGIGTAGSTGDGSAATAAQLNYPAALAFDAVGNLYIADYNNHRIRKVTTGGIISTIAGTGIAGFNGDGVAAAAAQLNNPYSLTFDAAGNLYIADFGNNRIRMVTPGGIISTFAGTGIGGSGGDGAAATAAQVYQTKGLTFDAAGNLYFAEDGGNRVRKITSGGIISKIAGTGSYGYTGDGGDALLAKMMSPSGLAIDAAGNLYISDPDNSRIRKLTP
ncbi:MAG: hypothetical protein H7338_08805 [Candidatus Sericytochromatia bacterium]|nr:hypothetical protein [Candidatus Sericytochromatia bacterium]